ncbi:MAG: hypothetical protein ACJA1N_000737 [Saprospiraceae bacterium]|jgi:uncharacterized protein YxeA
MATDKNKSSKEKTKDVNLEDDMTKKEVTFKDKVSSGVKTAKKVTIRIIIAAIILAIGGFAIYANMNYSEGDRVGKVVKVSKRGVFFKTWEGQLSYGDNKEMWEFSIPNSQEQVRINIDDASENNKRVKLYYKEKYITFPWRGDTKYIVYKVEVLK